MNGKDSKIETIVYKAVQDSCLSPLLFLVYIDDLLKAIKNILFTMFADDTSLSVQKKNPTSAVAACKSWT